MKKALNIIKAVLVWAIVAFAVGMMIFTVISVTTFDRTDRELFGHRALIVMSDSMAATDFNAGDLIFIREVDPGTLQVGDVIAYVSQNADNFGDTVTHKIRQCIEFRGEPAFITYGTSTGADDEMPVTYADILGKYTGRIPKLGTFFQFLKTTPGYILCIFLPFLLVILYQGLNCVQLFRRYRKEQLDAINAERAQIEEERRRSQEMMKELQALKEQLAAKDGPLEL